MISFIFDDVLHNKNLNQFFLRATIRGETKGTQQNRNMIMFHRILNIENNFDKRIHRFYIIRGEVSFHFEVNLVATSDEVELRSVYEIRATTICRGKTNK